MVDFIANRKKPTEVSSGSATIVKSKGPKSQKQKAVERELNEQEAMEIVIDILSSEIINGLVDSNWKNR